MTQEFFRTRAFCGRQYQAWSLNSQINLEPVDEAEEQRLRLQHDLLKLLFAQRVHPLIPDSISNPIHVLDCAYGTGQWASELAESFPDAQITGVDICPIFVQQNDRPDNFVPEVADLNKPEEAFEFVSESFNLVNSRFVAGGLAQARWPSYITDIRRYVMIKYSTRNFANAKEGAWQAFPDLVLKRGGAVEFIEWDLFFRANGGNGDRLAALRQWTESYLNAIGRGHGDGKKTRQSPPDIASMLESSGFANISATMLEVPLGRWPSTAELREIGQKARDMVASMLLSLGLYPIVDRAVMSEIDFRDLVTRCIQELDAQDTHPHIRLYVCYGEKSR